MGVCLLLPELSCFSPSWPQLTCSLQPTQKFKGLQRLHGLCPGCQLLGAPSMLISGVNISQRAERSAPHISKTYELFITELVNPEPFISLWWNLDSFFNRDCKNVFGKPFDKFLWINCYFLKDISWSLSERKRIQNEMLTYLFFNFITKE